MRAPGLTLLEAAVVLLLLGAVAALGASSFASVRDASSGRLTVPLMTAAAGDAARALSSGLPGPQLLSDLLAKDLPVVASEVDPQTREVSVALDDPAAPTLLLVSSRRDEGACLVAVSRTLDPAAALEWFAGPSTVGCAAGAMLSSGLLALTGGTPDAPAALP